MSEKLFERLVSIANLDRCYHPRAYEFVFEALEYTIHHRQVGGHVSGSELLEGIQGLALDQFGYLARTVFEFWGLSTTEDFGRIVFRLVEHDLMKKTDQDSIDEFCGGFDFRKDLEEAFVPNLTEISLESPCLSTSWPS